MSKHARDEGETREGQRTDSGAVRSRVDSIYRPQMPRPQLFMRRACL